MSKLTSVNNSGNRVDSQTIHVRNARTHNLRKISVDIPLQQLTVITGVSGSGKSSLVFDTIFAEGQYLFLRTLASSSSSLEMLPRGQVDEIIGLPPVVSVPQQRPTASPRSTVATITEILDYFRLLFARVGLLHCPECQVPVSSQSTEQMIQKILALPERAKIQLLAPMAREQRGKHRELLKRITREGFVRIRWNGQIIELADLDDLDEQTPHTIEVIVDRLLIKPDIRTRLADSIEQTLRLAEGACLVLAQTGEQQQEFLLHRDLNCSECERSFLPLEPRSFSWHSASGACPECEGRGMITDNDESIGVCPSCQGTRLNPVSSAVSIDEMTLPSLLSKNIKEALQWFDKLKQKLANGHDTSHDELSSQILSEISRPIQNRLQILGSLGLEYLSLDRTSKTLSAGEHQRLRLARCLGTELQGSCYVLDEPTAGLHRKDVSRLISILRDLVDQGNSVLCVEHNLDLIQTADFLIECGPGGGRAGGQLIFSGSVGQLKASAETPTARALRGDFDGAGISGEAIETTGRIRLIDSSLHNLKQVQIELPLNALTTVSGVSGSGKSSLILDALAPLLRQAITKRLSTVKDAVQGQLTLEGEIQSLQVVDQAPAGRGSRSCPATYCGVWDFIRGILAKTRAAKIRGFNERRFSFNSKVATCSKCEGKGVLTNRSQILDETALRCPDCQGQRFNPTTLSVTYRGRSAADLLEMTIDEAIDFWSEMASIIHLLRPMSEIGLGYLKLGQPANTLSGGESQRLKLAKSLSEQIQQAVLILDEPTTGLHWADISRFLLVLRKILERGNTIVLIEHHPLVLQAADWRIELGPGAGDAGGNVISQGPATN